MNNPLSDGEKEFYKREGYMLVRSVLGRDDLRRVDATIEELAKNALGSKDYNSILELEPELVEGKPVVRRIYHPFEQHEVFRAFAKDDRILDRVECLIGPSIQLQHSKLNMKAARVGSPVEWHQDMTYFPHTNTDLVTVLIYLDDATIDNGCLQVIPRLHDRYLLCHTPEGFFAGMITEKIESQGKPIALEGPAGSAIFMHCLTPHASLPNQSSKSRRTLIFEYRAADAYPVYYGARVTGDEQRVCQLRGEPSRYARFSGPSAPIPLMPKGAGGSLYQLQELTKGRAG